MFLKHLKKLPALLASSVLLLTAYDPPTTTIAIASTSLLIPSTIPAMAPVVASPALGFVPDAFSFPFFGPSANDGPNATAITADHIFDSNDPFVAVSDTHHHPPDAETMSLFDIGALDMEALEVVLPALLAIREVVGTGKVSVVSAIVLEGMKAALYLGGFNSQRGLGLGEELEKLDRLVTATILRLAIDSVFGALVVLLGRRGHRRRRRVIKACIGIVARELAAWTRGQSIVLVLAVVVGSYVRPASFALLRDGLLLGCLVPRHVLRAWIGVAAREVVVWARGQSIDLVLVAIGSHIRPVWFETIRHGVIVGLLSHIAVYLALVRWSAIAATPPPILKKKRWYTGRR
ncbi:hypothetical protein C8R43DRAFT_1120165 [Mycena crocata]|nr:hypothetical protein C8R43DRAFT_1120165 [Mycena crocata]